MLSRMQFPVPARSRAHRAACMLRHSALAVLATLACAGNVEAQVLQDWKDSQWAMAAQRDVVGKIRQVAVAADQRVWIATNGGLVRWTGFGKTTRIGAEQGLRQSDLRAVLVLRDQRIAVAGPYGVEIYDPRTDEVAHPMPIDTVFRWGCERLAEGPDGSLWVATVEGPLQLRAGKLPRLFGAGPRVAQIGKRLQVEVVALADELLDRVPIRGGTGVVQIPIGTSNVVVEVCEGSAAEEAEIQAGDCVRISPAPNTPGGKIKFRFAIDREGEGARTQDASARAFRATSLRLRARDLLVDRFATLWVSSGSRLLRIPLGADGEPDLARIELPKTIGRARDLRLRESRILGATWVFSGRPGSFPPQLFQRGASESTALTLDLKEARLFDLCESSVGSLFVATAPYGVRMSTRPGQWEAVESQFGALHARALALSRDDRLAVALPGMGVARCIPKKSLRAVGLERRLASVARDRSRWFYLAQDHKVVRIAPDGDELSYDVRERMKHYDSDSSSWQLVAHSAQLAWAVDREGRRMLRFAAGVVESFDVPDDFVAGAAGGIDLHVCGHGEAWIGPFGGSSASVIRFGHGGLRNIYRLPIGALATQPTTLPIFRFDGRVFLAHDDHVYELPQQTDLMTYVLAGEDLREDFQLPEIHGAICSAVSARDELWFGTTSSEVVHFERDGKATRHQLRGDGATIMRRTLDGAIWAVKSEVAYRHDAGSWRDVVDARELKDGNRILRTRILPSSRDDVFLACDESDGRARLYRWQESDARPEATLRIPTGAFDEIESSTFDAEARLRWHPNERNFEFQHRVNGGEWSAWTADPRLVFRGLAGGTHMLELRSRRSGSSVISAPIRHSFRIQRTWPVGALALAAMALLTLLGFGFARARGRMDRQSNTISRRATPDVEHDTRNLRMLLDSKLAELGRGGQDSDKQRRGEAEMAMHKLSREIHDASDQPGVTDVHELVSDIIGDLTKLLPARIHITTQLRAKHTAVRAQRGRLVQVLLNLLFNSHDAVNPRKRGLIEIRTRELMAHQCADLDCLAGICIEVEDNGDGMDPITREKCFRDRYTTKIGIGHRGHGLSTVRRLVENFGGRIVVESEHGRGCTFRLQLPSIKLRVLLCEDNKILRDFMRRGLMDRGVDANAVATAHEARRQFLQPQSVPYDAVVLDVQLDGANGLELARDLRRQGSRLPTIFVSGLDANEIEQCISSDSKSAVFEKPVDLDALVRRLRTLCDGYDRS